MPEINKEAKTIFESLKIAYEYSGFPEEIGSDNWKEFKNTLIEGYLKKKILNLYMDFHIIHIHKG